MTSNFSTHGIRNILTYPFQDPKAASKLAVACALAFAGYFIPVIPYLCLLGYFYEIMHRAIIGDGALALPDWDNWDRLLKNGLKYLGVSLVYLVPGMIIIVFGLLVYFIAIFGQIAASNHSSNGPVFPIFMGMGVLFTSQIVGLVLALVAGVLLSVGLGNLVARDRFSAGFAFRELWRVFRANFAGYLVSYIFLIGISSLLIFIMQMLYMTLVLCALIPLLSVPASLYIGLLANGLYARAYRESADRLNEGVIDVVPAAAQG